MLWLLKCCLQSSRLSFSLLCEKVQTIPWRRKKRRERESRSVIPFFSFVIFYPVWNLILFLQIRFGSLSLSFSSSPFCSICFKSFSFSPQKCSCHSFPSSDMEKGAWRRWRGGGGKEGGGCERKCLSDWTREDDSMKTPNPLLVLCSPATKWPKIPSTDTLVLKCSIHFPDCLLYPSPGTYTPSSYRQKYRQTRHTTHITSHRITWQKRKKEYTMDAMSKTSLVSRLFSFSRLTHYDNSRLPIYFRFTCVDCWWREHRHWHKHAIPPPNDWLVIKVILTFWGRGSAECWRERKRGGERIMWTTVSLSPFPAISSRTNTLTAYHWAWANDPTSCGSETC